MRTPCINIVAVSTSLLLLMTVTAAPLEPDDEQSVNALVAHGDSSEVDYAAPWDADSAAAAALRKLLLQLDAEDRLPRVTRSWPQLEPRGWGLASLDGRLPSFRRQQWRASKRETTARFRQCYFNPVSCFRK